MKRLTIRTRDEVLERALTLWWDGYAARLPEKEYVVCDLDSAEPTGSAYEVTISRQKETADLLRPFSLDSLENAFLRLFPAREAARLRFTGNRTFLDGEELRLTRLERRLLQLLWESDGPQSADALSEKLFGEKRASNQIGVYVSYLRKKTDLPGKERLIRTAKGKGYYIRYGQGTD